MELAMQYTESNPLALESDYPYLGYDNTCSANPSEGVVSATDIYEVEQNSVEDLMEAVSRGPVSVAIEADQQSF